MGLLMTLQLEQLDSLISPTTRQNWRKLGIITPKNQNLDSDFANLDNQGNNPYTKKLTTRANKKLSCKNITPTEYFCNAKNIALVQHIVRLIIQKTIPFQMPYIRSR